jgi:hypothetical protein
MDQRQLIVNCATATFYQQLATSQIMKNRRNKWRTPLQGQTLLNVRKTPRQDMGKVKAVQLQTAVSMACHCAIRAVDHPSEIMTAHGHGSTLQYIKLHRSNLKIQLC